jgi:hypothetical protein
MIDMRYHIVSLVAVFLALGIGLLIGSTIVSDDLMVGQQQKMIDGIEEKISALKERENLLTVENTSNNKVIGDYENFSRALLPPLVKNQLLGTGLAVLVTGGQDIPAGLLSTLSIAGANVLSQTVVLNNINMKDPILRQHLIKVYGLDEQVSSDVLQQKVATSVALIIASKAEPDMLKFLQDNSLLKFSGQYYIPVNGVILLGGADELGTSFPENFDGNIIAALLQEGKSVFGVEGSKVKSSYMTAYQKYDITTIDDIDLSPGQIALVLSMKGEPGDYGIKPTATKFMPALPVQYPGRK